MKLAAKWRVSWTMGDCRLDGYRMESVCVGGDWVDVVRLGRGAPLVLVPGLAGSWKLLLPLAQMLARHFDVIVPGLRGDGSVWSDLENPAHEVLSVSEYAQDLACVLDHLRLESPTVFGVSFGGAVALELAAEHRHRVGTLILSGIEARFQRTLGAAIARRALERFPLPSDSPFINQFFHLLYGTKPEPRPTRRLYRGAHLGDQPAQSWRGGWPRSNRSILPSALANRCADVDSGR